MKVKIFGKKGCAKCETTKNKFSFFLQKHNCHDKIRLEFYDMDTVEGMAEGAYYDVLKVPTTLIEKEDNVIAKWEGDIPETDEFKNYIVMEPILEAEEPKALNV
jgi:thiol-disulfide isomerase/thioredoxin